MPSIADRMKQAMDIRQMKQTDLVRKTGIGKSSISTYLSGDYEPKQKNIYKIAFALDVSEAWLMGYDVPMERQGNVGTAIPPGFESLPAMNKIPVVGQIACGEPITAEENIEGYASAPERWRADFALICKGRSMEPKIMDGDLVAIRSDAQVETGQIAAVRTGEEATLKKVYFYPERIILRPINDEFEDIVFEGEEMNNVSIEGKAVGLCRDI